METGITFVTHKGCNDGLFSAVVFKMLVLSNVFKNTLDSHEILFYDYDDDDNIPDSFKYKNVYFADYSVKPEKFIKLFNNGHNLVVIDHHPITLRRFDQLRNISNVITRYIPESEEVIKSSIDNRYYNGHYYANLDRERFEAVVSSHTCTASLFLDYVSRNVYSNAFFLLSNKFGKRLTSNLIYILHRVDDKDRQVYNYPNSDVIYRLFKGRQVNEVISILTDVELYSKLYNEFSIRST